MLLSTKQLDDVTLAYAKSLNFQVTCVDFIEVAPVAWDGGVLHAHDYHSVAFTSSNAVKYFFEHPEAAEWVKTKDVFSISGKTNEELAKHGVGALIVAENARELTEEVAKRKLTGSVLHVCGNMRLDTLEKMLTDAGISYFPLVVYNTRMINNLKLEQPFHVILFYSPSGVEGYLGSNQINEKTICCCIGNTTAARLKELVPDARILVSPFPSPKSMLERVAIYLNKPSI